MTPQSKIEARPFLMFPEKAEEAIRFYVSLFPDGQIVELERYAAGGAGAEGSLKRGVFTVAGQTIMATDGGLKHDFTFTPAVSLFVTCESEADVDRLFAALSEGGRTFMPPANYGFSRKFAWMADCYGLSWQLNW
jgi:predicted 3-demethylubiquinone-9 3-methyltransferase (glyoxalase superfamily)